jgi:hypothetical protein
MASYGWTWEYIDSNVTLPRLMAVLKYQANHRPVHVLLGALAAHFGISLKADQDKEGEGKPASQLDFFAALSQMDGAAVDPNIFNPG